MSEVLISVSSAIATPSPTPITGSSNTKNPEIACRYELSATIRITNGDLDAVLKILKWRIKSNRCTILLRPMPIKSPRPRLVAPTPI